MPRPPEPSDLPEHLKIKLESTQIFPQIGQKIERGLKKSTLCRQRTQTGRKVDANWRKLDANWRKLAIQVGDNTKISFLYFLPNKYNEIEFLRSPTEGRIFEARVEFYIWGK